jgi:hypothetical protein
MSAIGGYEQVINEAQILDIEGHGVRVLSLSQLIASKTAANRPKDLAVLPILSSWPKLAGTSVERCGPPAGAVATWPKWTTGRRKSHLPKRVRRRRTSANCARTNLPSRPPKWTNYPRPAA